MRWVMNESLLNKVAHCAVTPHSAPATYGRDDYEDNACDIHTLSTSFISK
jgi:hypothetical protein